MMNNTTGALTGISLNNIGKKFRDHWVFRGLSFQINKGDKVALNGHNGSGKSTLLQIIAGYVSPSEGSVTWNAASDPINTDDIFKHLVIAAPYLDLIDEFTLEENIDFFIRLKPIRKGLSKNDLIALTGIDKNTTGQFRYFSSGMKQKLRLTLAFTADTDLLLMDEPLSNLDQAGYKWYAEMAEKFSNGRTVLVCSNMVKDETYFCNRHLDIEEFKKPNSI